MNEQSEAQGIMERIAPETQKFIENTASLYGLSNEAVIVEILDAYVNEH